MARRVLVKKDEALVNGIVWTKEMIQDLINTSDAALYRSILKIYENQTDDEQEYFTTRHYNDVGFSGVHAEIMTSYAVFYEKNKYLTKNQKVVARKIMKKYAGQIIKMMRIENPQPSDKLNKIENKDKFKITKMPEEV